MPEEEEGRRKSRGLICEIKELQGLHCNYKFPANPELKRENGQNESCKTFQNL
jgi:adenylylsulfate kinase-like enzyme